MRPASRVDAWTSDVSKSFSSGQPPDVLGIPTTARQSKISETQKQGLSTSSSTISVSTSVTASPVQEPASVATFTTHIIQPTSSVLPVVSQAMPLVLPTAPLSPESPTHEGKIKIMNARDKFFGISRADNTNNEADSSQTVANGREEIPDYERSEQEDVVSPIGVYPEKYNTLKRRPKHETEALSKGKSNPDLDYANASLSVSEDDIGFMSDDQSEKLTVAAQAKKGLDTLQRKQRFQDYVSNVQNQAPQNYNSINMLKESVVGNGSQAMTREQRDEILNMMRKAKNNKAANSPTLPELTSKSVDDPPRHELTKIQENIFFPDPQVQHQQQHQQQQQQQQQQDNLSDKETSFRNSYHLGIEAENLDPDLAIIRAAEQMEQQLREKQQKPNRPDVSSPSQSEDPNVWLPNSSPFSRNSIAYQSFYDTEMSGNSFSHVPSMVSDDSYVYDPNKKPKSSILKVRKQGEMSQNELKNNGHKHWSLLSSKHNSIAMSPTDSISSLNSVRSITFSDMVDVEHTPVKICLMSGKPQTPMDDFKMLLQQHSGSRRGQSACSALNVQPRAQRPSNNAQLLYSGATSSSHPEEASKQGNTPSRKMVTMNDLRTAMANPSINSMTGDLGLPYEQLQAQNRQRSPKNSPAPSPSGTLSSQDEKVKIKLGFIPPNTAFHVDSSETASKKSIPNGNLSGGASVDQSSQLVNQDRGRGQNKDTEKSLPNPPNEGASNENKLNGPSRVTLVPGEASFNVNSNNSAESQTDKSQNEKIISKPQDKSPKLENGPLNLTAKPLHHLTESASDSILSRKDLMEDIRRRGARRDSREEAVSELESQQHRKLSASSMPSLTTTGNGLGSLLDSMKTALKSMAVNHPSGDVENEHDCAAWE